MGRSQASPIRREHVVGGVIFGLGWAVSCSCPGPLVAQIGAGRLPALATLAGACCGIALRNALSRRAAHVADVARPARRRRALEPVSG